MPERVVVDVCAKDNTPDPQKTSASSNAFIEENILPPGPNFDLLVEFGECYHYWIPQDNFTSTKTKGADGSALPDGFARYLRLALRLGEATEYSFALLSTTTITQRRLLIATSIGLVVGTFRCCHNLAIG